MPITETTSRLTTCPYCGVGCGVHASLGCSVEIRGDVSHPANFGRLCSKGSALAQTLQPRGRLLYPSLYGVRASWSQATEFVARQLQQVIDQHGPEAVGFYISGQLLTEDYYIANKLMKGFIGSANIDTNSRLCMASSVAGHKRAFGEDVVPGCYEDLELADLVVLTGSNTAWCHPVLFQRIKAARQNNPAMKVVVIDPRKTATCEIADLHLPLRPGSDVLLFNGLLAWLAAENALDHAYIAQHTRDFAPALAQALQDAASITEVAQGCDLKAEDVATFYRWFTATPRTVTCYSQGVNQSSSGTDKVNAILNCHLATGRIGKPGASPFSLTGQPNAMGGREVGGLANQLAAHMDFTPEAIDRVQRFWRAPRMATAPGLKAVELFRSVEEGRIKVLWIMATNPVVSLPDADQVKRALRHCPLVIVSDCIANTDTSDFAHVLLPAAGWSEKDGTVTNSERRISRQRALLPLAGEARPDWRIVRDVAQAMGFSKEFDCHSPADIFREHAALSAFENQGQRQFNLAGLQQLSDAEYEQLQPIQWPVLQPEVGTHRLYGNGVFSTADGRACFKPVRWQAPAHACTPEWPLVLNTGRVRDQWHTMTRTALAPTLNQHLPEPYAELHPATARRHGIADGEYVQIRSPWGQMLAKASVRDSMRENEIFVPMHWNEQFARNARVGALVNPATDPWSGQPESKHTPCRIAHWHPRWRGLLFSRHALPLPACSWACQIGGAGYFRYEIADDSPLPDWHTLMLQLGLAQNTAPTLFYEDSATHQYRWAQLEKGALHFCAFVAPDDAGSVPLADRNWIASLFARSKLEPLERKALLSGKSPAGVEDCGRIVCACFSVGEKTLRKTIAAQQLRTVNEVGKSLKAGTNCGSCVAEIKALLAS